MEIRLFLFLFLLPTQLAAVSSPTAAEIRAVANVPAQLTPLLVRWLDAYPESVEDWPTADFALVVAHIVGLGQGRHPIAALAAEDFVKRRTHEVPFRLERVAEALSLAARVRLQAGQNQAALVLLNQGSELCDRGRLSEGEATYCAFLMRDRAMLGMRLGHYDRPADDLDQAMAWLEPYPGSAAWVVVLNSAADLACSRGEVEACLERYRRATEVAEVQHGVDSEVAAYGYLGVGWAAALSGEWGQARASFEHAERVWSRHLGAQHPRLADALIEYGDLLRRAGDARAAVAVLRRAVGLRESRLGPGAFDLPRALDALGLALVDLGDLSAAEDVLKRSAAIRRQHLDEDHVDHARSMSALARLAQVGGDLSGARLLLTQALDLRRNAQGDSHPAWAEGVSNLAELYIEDQPDLALELATRAKDALAGTYGEDHPAVARAWWLEARAHLRAGSDAIPSALRSEAIGRRHLHRVAVGLSERDLLDYSRVKPDGADLALEALLARPTARRERIQAVWQGIARSRSVVFEALAERRRLASAASQSLEVRNLSRARQALARLLVSSSGADPASYAGRLAAARQRLDQAERSLSIQLPASPRRALDLSQLLGRLPQGEALLAYRIFSSRSGRRLAAFIAVGGTDRAMVQDLGPWDSIENQVRRSRQAFTSAPELEYRRLAAEVRRKIWDPLERLLAGSRRVSVVPDGALFLLSFPALPTERGYLIEEGPALHILSAERDLSRPADSLLPPGRVLIVGDPDFGEPRRKTALELRRVPTDFVALPQAREEAKAVADAWRRWNPDAKVQRLYGSEATEDRWRRNAPGAIALHLATHGFFLAAEPSAEGQRSSSRSLSDPRGVGGLAAAEPLPPPPLKPRLSRSSLSGFVLSGANQPSVGDGTRDGVVTLEEIEQLDLSSVHLAVLSFCDSGLGETMTGEGVFGLTRAFRGAGVDSLVLALAPVSDRDTKQFMERFYAALLGDGLDVDLAVRGASLALLAGRRQAGLDTHPFHWGAFVSVGAIRDVAPGRAR